MRRRFDLSPHPIKIVIQQNVPPLRVVFIGNAVDYGFKLNEKVAFTWAYFWDHLDRFAAIVTSDQLAAFFALARSSWNAADEYMMQAIELYEEQHDHGESVSDGVDDTDEAGDGPSANP